MGEVVNLNKARKARDARERKAAAGTNRVVHGLPKALKDKARTEEQGAREKLDAHRRDRPDSEPRD